MPSTELYNANLHNRPRVAGQNPNARFHSGYFTGGMLAGFRGIGSPLFFENDRTDYDRTNGKVSNNGNRHRRNCSGSSSGNWYILGERKLPGREVVTSPKGAINFVYLPIRPPGVAGMRNIYCWFFCECGLRQVASPTSGVSGIKGTGPMLFG